MRKRLRNIAVGAIHVLIFLVSSALLEIFSGSEESLHLSKRCTTNSVHVAVLRP
jgi:hypothetical protein